jgi:adenylate cyclase
MGTYAVAANMFLSGEFLDDGPWYVSALIALLFSCALALLVSRLKTGKSILAGLAALILLSGLLLLYFRVTRRYIGITVPLASSTLTFLSMMIFNFLGTSREKLFLHSAFSRYLSPAIINELIEDPSKLNLGGEKREMTAIFTDLQGFSTISEKLDPVKLVQLLNRYLTTMSTIIMENLGTVDKYEGDAIIAFFGAPVFHQNHAELACRSALGMKKAEKELNAALLAERGSPSPLFTRIGINTGDMVVGNMGAENKMDYTIMGNAVNLAARLEGVNKQYRTGILMSQYTRAQIGEEFICRSLDRVRVVGINTPVRLYELLALRDETLPEDLEVLTAWEQGIALFEAGSFAAAGEHFSLLAKKRPGDYTAQIYAERCRQYREEPPPAGWDGVRNLTEK